MNIQIINPLKRPDWDELLLSTPGSSFFHSSYWARVLHDTYGYKPLYFTLVDKGKLSVLIPLMEVQSIFTGKRGVSLPFSDYCEMLISKQVDFRNVMDELVAYGKKAQWRSIELMDGRYLPEDTLSCAYYYSHTLKLEKDSDSVMSTFHKSVKRNINKAMRNDVVVTISNSLAAIADFYRLHCLTRKRHGIPPQPYVFFKNIYKNVISHNQGFIVLASYKGGTTAGAIYFHFNDQVIFKYGASDVLYQHFRTNNLVMWRAIEWLCQNGFNKLSFGRTDPENDGLRRFKNGWGAVERIIKYYKYDLATSSFVSKAAQLSDMQKKIISKLPPCLLRTAGSLLYRHIG